MQSPFTASPSDGAWITIADSGSIVVPANPVVGWIEGDGVGPDLWNSARPVFDEAVRKAYGGTRAIRWWELAAGEKSFAHLGEYLPEETLKHIQQAVVVIKGPPHHPCGRRLPEPQRHAQTKARSIHVRAARKIHSRHALARASTRRC